MSMNRRMLLIAVSVGALALVVSCNSRPKQQSGQSEEIDTLQVESVVSEQIRFCESTYPYQGGMLIANFGCEQFNPLNSDGKGYILNYRDGQMSTLIANDGNLSAPKGMFERDGYLFICDVNKLVVYNLADTAQAPQIITFPKDALFLNDLVASGNTLYVSVTNNGQIYSLDITNPATMKSVKPVKWADVPGANGIVISDDQMYVASYPADGNTCDDNVIYHIADLAKPAPEKFITKSGQYDGIVFSADKKTMYITNWSPVGVFALDMETKQISELPLQTKVTGAADISIVDSVLYIPDLPNSQMIIFPLK